MASSTSAWQQMSGLPSAAWKIAAATFINRMGAMVFPFLILYFTRALKLDLPTATFITAFYGLGSAAAAPLGGWLSDRYDAVKVLYLSLGLAGLILIAFPLLSHPVWLTVATFAVALFSDISRPSVLTALARLTSSQRRRDAFALNYLAVNLGMSLGPLAGGYLATHSYSYLFWLDGASSIIACLLLIFSSTRAPALKEADVSSSWNIGGPAFRLILWLTVTILVFVSYFTASPVYLVEILNEPESMVGWLWLLNTLIVAIFSLYVNHWTRKVSLSSQLCGAALLFALGYLLLSIFSGLAGLVLCLLFLSIGEMMLFTNANSYLERVVNPGQLGKAMAFNSITFSIAISLSSPAVGYFFAQSSPDRFWLLLAFLSLVGALGFARLPRPTREA